MVRVGLHGLVARALLAASFCFGSCYAEPAAKKPFTVADSIAWTTVLNLGDDYSANPVAGTALASPDKSQFLLHTQRGVLAGNATIEALLLFRAADVAAYLTTPGAEPPRPRTLVQLRITDDAGTLTSIQWVGDAAIGFLAQGDNGQKQAFLVTLQDGVATQLTHSATPVTSFAVAGDRVLYYAHAKLQPPPLVQAVGDGMLGSFIFPATADSAPLELFQASRSTGVAKRVDVPAMRLYEGVFDSIWLSPGGDRAIIFVPAVNAPAYWADYQLLEYERAGYTASRISADPTSMALIFRTRYAIVDLEKNSVRPLLDAPSGWLAMNETPAAVFWPRDGRSVIVSNTFLPLDIADRKLREYRARRPAIAQVDLASGSVNTVLWESGVTDEERAAGRRRGWSIKALSWDDERNALTVIKSVRRSKAGELVYSGSMEGTIMVNESDRLTEEGGKWRVAAVRAVASAKPQLSIDLRQGMNERPKIHAADAAGRRKVLLDPNPSAEGLQFGHMEAIGWTEAKHGIEWKGGLIYPPGYVTGRRYPLIVQTHGFDPEQFLLDGPGVGSGSTAMAAQALANAGFLVLQVEDKPFDPAEEGERMAQGYCSGIQHLVSSGTADPDKVGLIAFSRTGYYLLYLLAQYPQLLAAANISDSVQVGYLAHMLRTNDVPDLMARFQAMGAGAPDMTRVGEWFASNVTYSLPRASAAIRIEGIGPGSVLGMWEMYSLLRRAGRPVDFISFHEGSHTLQKPLERLGSQGGNVDWFRFWLQGFEDPDPGKAAQYARWRALRAAESSQGRAKPK